MQENEKQRVAIDLTMEQFVECSTCHEKVAASHRFCPTDSTPLFRSQHQPEIPNYKIIKLLGSGGMGDVYEAEHVVLKKRVAIKTLKAHLNDSKAFLRFQAEAQATARLKHPNIVSVYDCGVSQAGEPYMVMDKVEGTTLAQLLETKGAMEVEQGLNIVLQVCQGVRCAHENGILHRDLKPGNVILETEGEKFSARVLDFGIAKILENEGSAANLTRTGELLGTPAYMSPEQANGEKVDQRSDIYSVGCILYEVLTGQPPFIGKTAIEVMIKHMNESALPLSQAALREFPAGLEAIVVRALAKKPADRFASVQEMINAFENFLNGINEPLVATVGGAVKVVKKDPLVSLYIFGGCSCSVILIGLILWSLSSEQKSAVIGQSLQTSHNERSVNNKADPQPVSNEANPSLELRAFSHDNLDNDQFKSYLSKNRLSKEISAKDCPGITDEVLKDVANCPNLGLLDLTDCSNITDDGLAALSQSRGLAVLKLHKCKKITTKGIAHLLRLPILFTLDTSFTNIDDGIFKILKTSRAHNVDLSHTKITDNALNAIGDKYENLDFKGTEITDSGLKKIAKLGRLKKLSLIKCDGITDTGIKSLIGMNLDQLWLDQTQITDAALNSIFQMKKLVNLSLRETQIDARGLVRLAAFKQLETLDVSKCPGINKSDIDDFRKNSHCKISWVPQS
jgi:serine/threonine protein kinase